MAHGVCNELCAYAGIAHVAGQRNAVCAGFSNTLLRFGGRMRRAVNGNVGSGFSQCYGDGGAESARGAGDEGNLTFQIESVEYQGIGPFRDFKVLISGTLRATSLPV